MGRNSEALKVARVGVEAAGKSGSLDKAVELLLAMVSIEEAAERPAKASKLLDEASGVAANITNDMLWLRIKVARIRLHRQLQPRQIKERRELRKEALNDVDADMLRRLRGYPVLLREVAAELGKDDPRIAAAAINTLGVEITTDEHAQALGKAIVELNASLDQMSKTPSPGGGSLRDRVLKKGADLFEAHSFDANVIREWVDKEGSAGQSQAISEIIKSAEPQTESLDGLRDYFRVGVKESLAGPRNRELV
jgi:hypothetical protein